MVASKTGTLHGRTIELESDVPEMDGLRVRVFLEPIEEEPLSAPEQATLWQAWVDSGPQGPIEDGPDTE